MRRVEIEVLAQEACHRGALQAALSGEDARQTSRLHAQHVQAYAALQENVRQRQLLAAQHPLAAHLPGSDAYAQLARLEMEGQRLREINLQAYKAWLAQRARTGDAAHAALPAPFAIDGQALAAALAPVHAAIAAGEAQLARNWIGRWRGPVMDVAPTAALLVLSAILLPAAIKAFFISCWRPSPPACRRCRSRANCSSKAPPCPCRRRANRAFPPFRKPCSSSLDSRC
jgi:hypothetical protein